MSQRRILLAVLLFGLGVQVHASKIIGNGGNVVVCEAAQSPSIVGTPPKIQLLDFYEAVKLHNLALSDPDGETYQEKVAHLLDKVGRRFPDLADQIGKEFRNFETRKGLIGGVVLEDTVDSYHAVLPRECHIEQAAIQRPPMFPRDPWFIISKDLWDGLDELNKAGLAMHESLYRIGVRNGAEHSRGVRYLVGLMFSTEFMQVSDQDWISGMLESRVRNYEMDGAKIPLFTGEFQSCEPLPGETTCDKTESLRPAKFDFDSDGMLREVDYDSEVRIELPAANDTVGYFSMSQVRVSRSLDQGAHVLLQGEGRVELVEEFQLATAYDPLNLVFSGTLMPAEGKFSGLVSTYDYKKEPNTPMRQVSASLSQIRADAKNLAKVKAGFDDVISTPLR